MSQFTRLSNLYFSDFTKFSFNKTLKKCANRAYYGRKTHLILRFTNIDSGKANIYFTEWSNCQKTPKLTIEIIYIRAIVGTGFLRGVSGYFLHEIKCSLRCVAFV